MSVRLKTNSQSPNELTTNSAQPAPRACPIRALAGELAQVQALTVLLLDFVSDLEHGGNWR